MWQYLGAADFVHREGVSIEESTMGGYTSFCDEHVLRVHDLRPVCRDGAGLVEVALGALASGGDGSAQGVADEVARPGGFGAAQLPLGEDNAQELLVAECPDPFVRNRDERVVGDEDDRTVTSVSVEFSTTSDGREHQMTEVRLCEVRAPHDFLLVRDGGRVPREIVLPELVVSVLDDQLLVPAHTRQTHVGILFPTEVFQPLLDVGAAEDVVFCEAGADEGLAQFAQGFVEERFHFYLFYEGRFEGSTPLATCWIPATEVGSGGNS